ncbi:MAG TPA: hypothetical protein EYP02_07165 [Sulfurovum sp.]|nr:hypothetical protein [Sulfurovum sp.]HIM94771.1 hypothetical protein [Campylobacterales bacterium]
MSEITTTNTVDTELIDEPEDMFQTYLTTSTKLRKKMINIYEERLEQQRLVLQKKVELDKDIVHKNLYSEYLEKITIIEKEAVDRLNKLSLERELELANDKDELYSYFDDARKKLDKWKESSPKRYKSEMEYLDKNESSKIKTIEDNALQLFEQSQKMFDEIVEIFYDNDKKIKKL